MKTISLKDGMMIFADQIAFIRVQPSSKDSKSSPEIHVHFSAALSSPKGSRSMRAVIREDNAEDFISQLEKFDVDCTHMRARIEECKQTV